MYTNLDSVIKDLLILQIFAFSVCNSGFSFLLGSFFFFFSPNVLIVRKIATDARLSVCLWLKESRALKYPP